ncbi:uncharacterized protein VTP21DRAFT_1261 [Calcarisporiella thermophila]|uniref:uncharacterized protein n=1 Tax=Calcarisporiella thermophila TaxID=911321 RepID=UPI0037442954
MTQDVLTQENPVTNSMSQDLDQALSIEELRIKAEDARITAIKKLISRRDSMLKQLLFFESNTDRDEVAITPDDGWLKANQDKIKEYLEKNRLNGYAPPYF